MANSAPAWVTDIMVAVDVGGQPQTLPSNSATFVTGQKNVTQAGIPEQLSATSIPVKDGKKLTMIAKPGNTGVIYFANTQALCVAGTYFDGLAAGLAHSFGVQDAQNIWIDASVSGEGVSFYIET